MFYLPVDQKDEQLYIIDPFEGKVIVSAEAIDYLSGQSFTKYDGEGAERLLFVNDDKLIVSLEDTLPPYIANLDDFADYEGKELLKLTNNEDYLLEAEDGTTYMRD